MGNEYVVLLNNVDNGILYTLSSKHSVFSMQEAEENEQLRQLLATGEFVTAPESPSTEEILDAERQAAGIQ